jgi:hypothetical protein
MKLQEGKGFAQYYLTCKNLLIYFNNSYKRNNEARPCNHRCSGKAMNITYSE